MSGDNCEPVHISWWADSLVKFQDRFLNYQLWLIVMIWLYWPTPSRKQENRSRMKAARTLKTGWVPEATVMTGMDDEGAQIISRFSLNEQLNSSLDGDSYFDSYGSNIENGT